MQVVPGFPTDFTSVEPTAVVRVNGVLVRFDSVTVSSDLESAMPSQVAAAGGAVVAATGDLGLIAGGTDTQASPGNPWGRGVPGQGATVEIEVGYDGNNVRIFTGVTDGTSGVATDPVVNVGLIDGVDRLDRPAELPPMLSTWPSLTDGDWTWRRVGLSPLHFTNIALRSAGIYATPIASGARVFAAQLMGSVWPEVGEVVTARSQTLESAGAAFRQVPWGIALGNGTVRYNPDLGVSSGRLDSTFQMVFNLNLRDAATTSLAWALHWGNDSIRVAVTSDGMIAAQVRSAGGSYANIVTLDRSIYGNSDTFAVRWIPSGNVTIYASNGTNATATGTLPASITTTAMTHVLLDVPEASHDLGGLQATYSTYPFQDWKRSAVLTSPASEFGEFSVPSIAAFPHMTGTSASLLKQQAEAELAAMWFDEYGIFRWVNRVALAGSAPVGTLTSLDNLLDLSWEIPAKSVYSSVSVVALAPTITRRAQSSITFRQGGSSSLDNLDEDNLFIEPPADESWLMVDPPTRANNVDSNSVRQGRGSIIGGVLTDAGQADRLTTWAEFNQSWTQANPQRWLLTSKADIGPTAQIEPRLLEGSQYGKYSGADLPLFRGKVKARWEEEVTKGVNTGPSSAAELRHEVGPWIQGAAEIQGVADWLSERLTSTSPILRDVPIVPDPRIQKGDVFWLEDTHAYGVRLKVLVMGISLTITAGPPLVMEQSITCRIIVAQRPWVSLDEHDAVWEGKTLDQQDAFWAGSTLDQHDANPLAH